MIEILKAHRAAYIDRMVAKLTAQVPHYSALGADELRRNIDRFFDVLVPLLEEGAEVESVKDRFCALAQERIEQGFAPSDFLQSVFLIPPVIREVIPSAEAGETLLAVERKLHELAALAATVYTDVMGRRLKAKNQELNLLNARLLAQEKLLSIEAMGASRALEAANEFNRRVIESLTSGLMVVDAQSMRVTLFTSRAEEITGIEAEKVLGRPLPEAFAHVQGVEIEQMTSTVRSLGRLHLNKYTLTLPDGRRRSVYIRAQRMFDAAGAPRGTVVVFDDITERELLFDSFSRYVSRDLLRRLLAPAGPEALARERRSTSILFVHLAGLVALGEALPAEQLHGTLDTYFRAVIDGITLHGGFIDKFAGDKVMALFSMAVEPQVTAAAAARAALAVQERTSQLSAERAARGEPVLAVCIGINTGDVVLGNMGNEERMTFTAIGDAVNVADAICMAAKPGSVLLSASSAKLVEAHFPLKALGPFVAPGRAGSIKPYELLAAEERRA
jgi:PAS domain S-box-containing protein